MIPSFKKKMKMKVSLSAPQAAPIQKSARRRSASLGVSRTYLCINVLEISQTVLAVLGVSDVIFSHLLIATGGEKNAIHETRDSSSIILLVFLVPVCGNVIGRMSRTKYLGCTHEIKG